MPVWGWTLIAVAAVIAVAAIVIANAASRRKKAEGLKERFGPEYERTVSETGGERSAVKELADRERTRKKLDVVPLTPAALEAFANRWREVQTAFVDDPASAVGEADRLVSEVMRERGYPVDDFDRQAADVSVDHPTVVENYRAAHGIHLAQEKGGVGTEEQRTAFVHYRALFEKLLEASPSSTPSSAPTRRDVRDTSPRDTSPRDTSPRDTSPRDKSQEASA